MPNDIVERLRLFGSSAVEREAADEIKRLRDQNDDAIRETITELRQRVETLTAERDEARKIVCELNQLIHIGISSQASSSTRIREWDCFKEEE